MEWFVRTADGRRLAVEDADGAADMIAVIRAIADRTARQRTRPAPYQRGSLRS
jgi:hypothetical protein